jgi:phosphotransferase system enzyme I (PtsI)
MAGEVALTRLLLGLGLRQFSMHPAQLLAVKQQVLRSSIPELEVFAQRILRSEDPERSRALLVKLNS